MYFLLVAVFIGLCPTEGLINFNIHDCYPKKGKRIVQCAYNCLLCVIKYISVRKELHLRHTKLPFLCVQCQKSYDQKIFLQIRLIFTYQDLFLHRIHRFLSCELWACLCCIGLSLMSVRECQYNDGRVFLKLVPML